MQKPLRREAPQELGLTRAQAHRLGQPVAERARGGAAPAVVAGIEASRDLPSTTAPTCARRTGARERKTPGSREPQLGPSPDLQCSRSRRRVRCRRAPVRRRRPPAPATPPPHTESPPPPRVNTTTPPATATHMQPAQAQTRHRQSLNPVVRVGGTRRLNLRTHRRARPDTLRGEQPHHHCSSASAHRIAGTWGGP